MTEARLASIERTVGETNVMLKHLAEKVDSGIDHADQRHAELARCLYGNNGSPGIVIRLDRLEQLQLRQQWFTKTIIGILAGLIVTTIWSSVTG